MKSKTAREFVNDLRLALVKATEGCELQEGAGKSGWPCGTCVVALLSEVMPPSDAQYEEHNNPVDRMNEVWRGILQIRDYKG